MKQSKKQKNNEFNYLSTPEGKANLNSQTSLLIIYLTLPLVLVWLSKYKIDISDWLPLKLFLIVFILILIIAVPIAFINHEHMRRVMNGEKYLMINGIYSHSRNPFYLSQWILFGSLGIGTLYLSYMAFFYFIFFFIINIYFTMKTIRLEEIKLENRFRGKYKEYMSRTPRFIPKDMIGLLYKIILWYNGKYATTGE